MKKKLKIAVVMQSPDIGGAETFMISLLSQFSKKGNEVIIATNRGKYFQKVQSDLGIRPIELPFILDIMGNLRGLIKSVILLPFALFFYLRVLLGFKKKGVDLVLMSGFSEKLFVTFLSVFFKIPVFWIEYGPLEVVFRRNFGIPKLTYRVISKIPKG